MGIEQKGTQTMCRLFFWQDTDASVKYQKFFSDHQDAEQDIIVFKVD
jgi:hypothetical protein